MRKFILTLALAVSLVGALSAQVEGKAIGLRLGGGFGYGAEVSYQQPISGNNRLELDLGANTNGFGLNGVYQWVWDLSDLGDGFNWYAGVGAGIGAYDFNNDANHVRSTEFSVGILGQVGLEYNFEIPLQISLDYRPGIFVVPSFNGTYDGICLSGRYRF